MRRARARLRAAIAGAASVSLLLAGCRDEVVAQRPEPAEASAPKAEAAPKASARRPALPAMQVSVADVWTDPTLDPQEIRAALRDAEGGLLSCLDQDGTTGAIVLSFPIERDGAVGEIAAGAQTTYGSEDARACVARLVGAMRFPATHSAHSQVRITLEVRTRPGG